MNTGTPSIPAATPIPNLPTVLAVSRDAGDYRVLRVVCAERPTDAQLSAVHQLLTNRSKTA